jgi:hypothetical protein
MSRRARRADFQEFQRRVGIRMNACRSTAAGRSNLLEPPAGLSPFGPSLYARRTDIERDFSGLTCPGGGLAALPPWVRRIWRVRPWVTAKLLINAARIRLNRKKAS